MGVGIRGYNVRFADSDGVTRQEGANHVRLRGSIAIIWSKPYSENRSNRSPRGHYMAEIYALR